MNKLFAIASSFYMTTKKTLKGTTIKRSGVIATRAFLVVLFIPVILVIVTFLLAVMSGHVSESNTKIIETGLNIIDRIFIPSVLTTVVGFLGLFVDKDNDGIPDKLENNTFNNSNDMRGNLNNESRDRYKRLE